MKTKHFHCALIFYIGLVILGALPSICRFETKKYLASKLLGLNPTIGIGAKEKKGLLSFNIDEKTISSWCWLLAAD